MVIESSQPSGGGGGGDGGTEEQTEEDTTPDPGSNIGGAQPFDPPDAPEPDDDTNGGSDDTGGTTAPDTGDDTGGAQPVPDAGDPGSGLDDQPDDTGDTTPDPGDDTGGAQPVGGLNGEPGGALDDDSTPDPGSNIGGAQPVGGLNGDPGSALDGDAPDGSTIIATGVEDRGIDSGQAINRATGSGVAAWEIEDRAADFEQEIIASTPADADDVSIAIQEQDGGLVFTPQFTEEYQQEQEQARAIDAGLARSEAIGQASAERSTALRAEQAARGERRVDVISDLGGGLVGAGTSTVGGIADLFDSDGEQTVGDLQAGDGQLGGPAWYGQETIDTTPRDDEFTADVDGGDGGLFGGLEDAAQPILGPPGTLESEAGYAASDPVGAITGAPGSIEAGAGDVAFGVRDVSASAAGTVGPVAGDILRAPIDAPRYLGMSLFDEDVEPTVAEEAGSDFLESAGSGLTEATIGAPAGAVELGDLGARAGEFTAREVEAEGVVEGGTSAAVAGGEFGVGVAQSVYQQATENPVGFSGMVTGGLVGGVGTARAFERATTGARVRTQTSGERVQFEDITSERGARGELPEFDTDPGAPTAQAVSEIRERATDQPETLQADLGESILFRSETERLPSDVEAGTGQYELPGLFASPDASPLRLDIGAESSLTSFRPRLPRPFSSPQRLSGFETPDVEGMPQSATGARRIADPEGGTIPDPETGGAQFLTQEAEAGTAFVRPSGSRTTELEAIYPPGSQFTRQGARAVDVPGGAPATLDIFRRVDADDGDVDLPDDELLSREEIIRRESRSGATQGQPVSPFGTSPSGGVSGTVTETFGGVRTGGTTTTRGGVTDGVTTGFPTTDTAVSSGVTESITGTTAGTQTTPSEPTGTASGGGSGTSGGPTDPSGIFTGTPTTPTQPTETPPNTPTTPPTTPTRTPPGPPTTPTTGIPTTPTGDTPPPPPTITPRQRDDGDETEDFNPFEDPGPSGQQFVNPVATGQQFLFGGFGGGRSENDGNGQNDGDDVMSLFTG